VQLELERVVFVPVGAAPHRRIPDDPGPELRLRMTELATAGDSRFAVSRIELDRAGPSYTSDTLAELSGRSPDDELVLILGGDQAAALPSWHEPEVVLELAKVAVAERGDYGRDRIRDAVDRLDGAGRIEFFDMPRIELSSTLVRRRVATGLPIRYLVPEKVAALIGAEGLYGAVAPVAAR
jgi:nicotinate-nucleotide adenylyltransferase